MYKLSLKFSFLFFFFIKISLSLAEENKFIIVSTANPLATKAGKEILIQGGNAIDAAIAIQMVLNVVEPQSSGIGGGGFLLYFDKKDSNLIFYDGRETAPSQIKKEFFLNKQGKPLKFYDAAIGGLAIGVPGLVSMLDLAHQKHGLARWDDLFKPAIQLSSDGFKISPRLHKQIKKDQYLYRLPNSKKYFYHKNTEPKNEGEILRNKELAKTLKIISMNRSKGFYEGDVAKKIISGIQNSPVRKGVMSLEDLKNYKAITRNAVCGKYRKYKICSAPPPSAGGFSILQILGILENFTLSKKTINQDIHLVLEASKYAYLDRFRYLGDPAFSTIDLNHFLSKKYLKKISAKISIDKSTKLNFDHYDETEQNRNSTTHFSIMDKYKNIVSMTSSIENSFGSRLMTAGFLLNNQLSDFNFKEENNLYKNNIIQPGKRPLSSMSPTIIFDENNDVKIVIGSPGGKSIIMYIIKTIIAVLDWNYSIQDAVDFPNFSLNKNIVMVEKNEFGKNMKQYLKNLGHQIKDGILVNITNC